MQALLARRDFLDAVRGSIYGCLTWPEGQLLYHGCRVRAGRFDTNGVRHPVWFSADKAYAAEYMYHEAPGADIEGRFLLTVQPRRPLALVHARGFDFCMKVEAHGVPIRDYQDFKRQWLVVACAAALGSEAPSKLDGYAEYLDDGLERAGDVFLQAPWRDAELVRIEAGPTLAWYQEAYGTGAFEKIIRQDCLEKLWPRR